jgi:site-specific DNA recombinase
MDAFRVLEQQKQVIARDYLRVSRDRSGRSRSTDEQHGDHELDCAANSWVMGESYVDKVSASRYGRKKRHGFAELLADLEHDRFGASVLMLWEGSRGSRQIEEWVALVTLCERRGVFIWVHTHERLYDLSNYRHRKELLEDALESEAESAKTSGRTKRNTTASAAAGKPHGPAPFGYRRIYDPHTRELIAQEPVPGEAELVQELYRRILAGHSMRSISRDWDARGVRTRSGLAWSSQHFRSLVLSPTYAGLRGHTPGRVSGTLVTASNLFEGIWPGLVSRADWYAVQSLLLSRERKGSRPGRGKHLLSFIARCGVCEGPLATICRRDRMEYICNFVGCVRIVKSNLDEYVEGVLLGYLAQPRIVEALRARDDTEGEEVERLRDELAGVRAEHEELSREVGAGRVSAVLAAAAEPGILERMAELEKRIKRLSVPSPLRGLVEPGADVAQRWEQAPMSTRRETVRAVFTAERLGQLRVQRSPRRGSLQVPAAERVQFWRADSDGTAAA